MEDIDAVATAGHQNVENDRFHGLVRMVNQYLSYGNLAEGAWAGNQSNAFELATTSSAKDSAVSSEMAYKSSRHRSVQSNVF